MKIIEQDIAFILIHTVRYWLNRFEDGNVPTTGCEKYSTLAAPAVDDKSIPKKFWLDQNSILANCSLYKESSVIGAKTILPSDGYIFPPGFKNLSRAVTYDSNILSCTRRNPIGSLMMTSTFSGISIKSWPVYFGGQAIGFLIALPFSELIFKNKTLKQCIEIFKI